MILIALQLGSCEGIILPHTFSSPISPVPTTPVGKTVTPNARVTSPTCPVKGSSVGGKTTAELTTDSLPSALVAETPVDLLLRFQQLVHHQNQWCLLSLFL